MNWQDVRALYPGRWILIEAVEATTVNDRRILVDVMPIETFANSMDAMSRYATFSCLRALLIQIGDIDRQRKTPRMAPGGWSEVV